MFDGSEGSKITRAVAQKFTQDWRTAQAGKTKGVFIGRDHVLDILNETGCMGIRVYFAVDAANEYTIVMVGADANESDMLAGPIVEVGAKCPPLCSPSILNT